MKKIIIIGAGGHAKVIYDILMSIKRKKTDDVEVLGFLDDSFDHLACRELFELPIIGKISRLDEFAGGGIFCVCAIGNNGARRNICDKYAQFKFYTAIPKITVGSRVMVGAGTTIIRDIPDDCTVAGNPARILKNRGI